jgi:hypothetical protein
MKRTISAVVVMSVMAALVLSLNPVAVSAAQLGNNINLPGLNFGMSSYKQYDGAMAFSSNLSTLDQIDNVFVSFNKDTQNPSQGWVSINFSGVVGTPVTQKNWQNSSMHIGYRGLHADTNLGIGAYQDVTGWNYPLGGGEGSPIYGDWMSTANGSVTLSGVSLLSSNGGYDEYTYYDYDGKGIMSGSGNTITSFSAYAQFEVLFDNPMAAAVYSGMEPMQMSATPEPATLALLGLGGIVTLVRRHRRRQ